MTPSGAKLLPSHPNLCNYKQAKRPLINSTYYSKARSLTILIAGSV